MLGSDETCWCAGMHRAVPPPDPPPCTDFRHTIPCSAILSRPPRYSHGRTPRPSLPISRRFERVDHIFMVKSAEHVARIGSCKWLSLCFRICMYMQMQM